MFKFLKNKKFRIILFIFSSLFALIIFFVFYIFLSINRNNDDVAHRQTLDMSYGYQSNGKLVQKIPDLGDLLTGPVISTLDPIRGSAEAPVAIVYFADFECKICQEQEKVIKNIVEKYREQVKLIWKDYPESDKNSISYKAAIAARCAQEQNKFWEYHDGLFKTKDLTDKNFLNIAGELELNKNKFEKCLTGAEAKKLVDDNIEEANALDITGVPFIYINNQEIMGRASLDDLEKIVEIELNRKR